MITTGVQLHWDHPFVMDKHSVGGIPGNRTTPIVVAIVAAAGLMIPKTSSRAITSPSGTADTVETMTCVNLPVPQIRRVVEREKFILCLPLQHFMLQKKWLHGSVKMPIHLLLLVLMKKANNGSLK